MANEFKIGAFLGKLVELNGNNKSRWQSDQQVANMTTSSRVRIRTFIIAFEPADSHSYMQEVVDGQRSALW